MLARCLTPFPAVSLALTIPLCWLSSHAQGVFLDSIAALLIVADVDHNQIHGSSSVHLQTDGLARCDAGDVPHRRLELEQDLTESAQTALRRRAVHREPCERPAADDKRRRDRLSRERGEDERQRKPCQRREDDEQGE